jgi:hypothetical protein
MANALTVMWDKFPDPTNNYVGFMNAEYGDEV